MRKKNRNSVIKILKNYSEQIFYSYNTKSNRKLVCINEILIKPKDRSINDVLTSFANTIDQVEPNGINTYKVTIKANYNALEIANSIYQKGSVEYSHPNFFADIVKFQNDPLYSDQYYLNNTGQLGGTAGIDINAPEAWGFTTGLNPVRVAVIDDGVENHTELEGRILQGFTPTNPTGFGAPNANGAHGQAVTGIIAATMNNGLNITGIAPCSDIIPINIFNGGETINDLANAIDWAWNQGQADVISNSWGFTENGTFFDAIENAINNARTLGRNGLGTVVVFASGNSNQSFSGVTHPADVDGVLTVGAIKNTGTIWNYSSRGSEMDIVTPSGDVNLNGNVRTIDREGANGYESGNFTTRFGGTSAACPQVSGVVALMLSANSNLTEQQVRTILRNTATDMGTNGFDNTFGFGRLNAFSALQQAIPISGPSTLCTSNQTYITNNTAGTTVSWSVSPTSLFAVDSGTGSSFTTRATSSNTSGSGIITATISGSCGSVEFTKEVWVGRPVSIGGTLSGPSSASVGQLLTYTHYNPTTPNGGTYDWTLPKNVKFCTSCWSLLPGSDDSGFQLKPIAGSTSGYVRVRKSNVCGNGGAKIIYVTVSGGGGGGIELKAAPNPADTEVSINISNVFAGQKGGTADVFLYDKSMNLVFSAKTNQRDLIIPTTNLPDGNYILKIVFSDKVFQRHIIIKH